MSTVEDMQNWSLNAPSGAGCFLTITDQLDTWGIHYVLMHLLVLGAF